VFVDDVKTSANESRFGGIMLESEEESEHSNSIFCPLPPGTLELALMARSLFPEKLL
jgi:hypothetical protein